jgi:hypothetical protein
MVLIQQHSHLPLSVAVEDQRNLTRLMRITQQQLVVLVEVDLGEITAQTTQDALEQLAKVTLVEIVDLLVALMQVQVAEVQALQQMVLEVTRLLVVAAQVALVDFQ